LEKLGEFGDKIDWVAFVKRVQKHAVEHADTVSSCFSVLVD
jgi:hypothetical protein